MLTLSHYRQRFVWLSIWIVVASSGVTSWAGQAVVTTTDGRQFVGEVVSEDDEAITLLISGIRTPIPRLDIQEIQFAQTIEDQYQQRRTELESSDWGGHYQLAKWLFDNQEYLLAQKELRDLNARLTDAADEELRYQIDLLDRAVAFRLKLLDEADGATEKSPDPAEGDDTVGGEPSIPPHSADQRDRAMLSDEQINTIKVFELPEDLFVTRPHVTITPQMIDELYEKYSGDERLPSKRVYSAWPGYKQLDLIFQLKARHLYSQVRVRNDPPVMREFRTIHRQYVLNYCGSDRCHGGGDAEGFFLFRDRPEDPRTLYTNFFVLHSTSVDNHDMIDRLDPSSSLLLQYGLPRDQATKVHPDVPGWRPKLTSPQLPMYQRTQQWIGALWKPVPDYGFSITPAPEATGVSPDNPQKESSSDSTSSQ